MHNLTIRLIVVLIGVWGIAANAESFLMPFGGHVYLEATSAKTGADWKFGIGTTKQNCHVYLTSLPDTSHPNGEVPADYIKAGETIRFCMWSKYGTNTAWAFSDGTDAASTVAFGDTANALRMGGNVIEQTSPTTWMMHLDNAISYLYDDSNDDILVRIRIDAAVAPPPSLSSVTATQTPVAAPNRGATAPATSSAKSWQKATVTDISDERV